MEKKIINVNFRDQFEQSHCCVNCGSYNVSRYYNGLLRCQQCYDEIILKKQVNHCIDCFIESNDNQH